jgi:hypothetical protein
LNWVSGSSSSSMDHTAQTTAISVKAHRQVRMAQSKPSTAVAALVSVVPSMLLHPCASQADCMTVWNSVARHAMLVASWGVWQDFFFL